MEAHDIWVSEAQSINFNLGTIWFKFSALAVSKGMRPIQVSYTGVMPREPDNFPNGGNSGKFTAKKVYAVCCKFKVKADEYDRAKANELCENLATMFAIKHNVSWEIWQRIRENKKFAEHLVEPHESYVKSLTKVRMEWLMNQYKEQW
jgi:hypothetical protein